MNVKVLVKSRMKLQRLINEEETRSTDSLLKTGGRELSEFQHCVPNYWASIKLLVNTNFKFRRSNPDILAFFKLHWESIARNVVSNTIQMTRNGRISLFQVFQIIRQIAKVQQIILSKRVEV